MEHSPGPKTHSTLTQHELSRGSSASSSPRRTVAQSEFPSIAEAEEWVRRSRLYVDSLRREFAEAQEKLAIFERILEAAKARCSPGSPE